MEAAADKERVLNCNGLELHLVLLRVHANVAPEEAIGGVGDANVRNDWRSAARVSPDADSTDAPYGEVLHNAVTDVWPAFHTSFDDNAHAAAVQSVVLKAGPMHAEAVHP